MVQFLLRDLPQQRLPSVAMRECGQSCGKTTFVMCVQYYYIYYIYIFLNCLTLKFLGK